MRRSEINQIARRLQAPPGDPRGTEGHNNGYDRPDATHAQGYLTVPGGFGQITSIVNFNSNSDKFVVDKTGSGLPRELQFAVRVRF